MAIEDIPEFVEVAPGDLIRAEDYNEIQRRTRHSIRSHRHSRLAGDPPDDTATEDHALQIETKEIAGGAVTQDKIAGGAVTQDKIAEGAVTQDKLGTPINHSFLTLDDGSNPHGTTAADVDSEGGDDQLVARINAGAGVIDKERVAAGVGARGWVRMPFYPLALEGYPSFVISGSLLAVSDAGGGYGVMAIPIPPEMNNAFAEADSLPSLPVP